LLKTIFSKISKIYVFVFLAFFALTLAKAADYQIFSLYVKCIVNRDGSLTMREEILYNARELNGIFHDIDYKGYGQIKINNVYVEIDKYNSSENVGTPYTDEYGSQYIEAKRSNSTYFGNYSVTDNDGVYSIKLYAQTYNKMRKFIFTYTLPYGVTIYNDVAQLNRKFVGTEFDDINNVIVHVRFPQEIKEGDLLAFAHGPLTGEVDILNNQEVLFKLNRYSTRDFVEGNIIFPRNIIDNNYNGPKYNYDNLKNILASEKKMANAANRERFIALILVIFFVLGAISWLILLILTIIMGSKKNKPTFAVPKYLRELPDNHTPAVAGTIMEKHMYPDNTQLLATILDLVRKKYLKMEIVSKDPPNTLLIKIDGTDESKLKDYEKYVLDWYIDKLGDGKQIMLENIGSNFKKLDYSAQFEYNYKKWQNLVLSDMTQLKLTYEKYKPYIKKLIFRFGIGYIILGFGIPSIFIKRLGNEGIFFTSYIILGALMLFSSKAKLRESQERIDAHEKWNAFKRFIKDFSRLEDGQLESIYLWEHYFVYAVALGISENFAKQFEKLMKKLPDVEYEKIMNNYPILRNITRYGYENSFFDSFRRSTNINHASNIVVEEGRKRTIFTSRSSSDWGGGGGFSGGSSGGGGGRGGGRGF
jgi:uncharacterized membrane protein